MSVTIQVKVSNDISHIVDISFTSTVNDIKRQLSMKTDLHPDSFDLIFSGKVLRNDSTIKELSLGQGSVVHVYTGRKTSTPAVKVEHHVKGQPQYQYFVYCKTCGDLKPGKLRVYCSTCHEGAIILSKEPDNWDDVLQRDRLDGHCTACDTNRFTQFYFKCSSHDGQEHSIPLRHFRPNFRHRECIICTNESSPVLIYPCQNKHVICLDCFKQYAAVSLDNRTFIQDPDVGYSLPCPAGCEDSLIKDIHHFYLLGKTQYERYKDFGAEECLIRTGGIICPQPGCGEGLMVDAEATSVTCRSCYFEFCRHCRMEVHTGECQSPSSASQMPEFDSERALRSQWDFQSMETIQHTTKACPHCGARIEKDGGCMHILCTCCKKDWCWLCEKEWSRMCQGEHWFG